ncbi:extracellular solute-binding protein [Microvirga alba]|uniref:Extracellular solute-binding protein n=1 Tax=Microvirga alba TaxID=2791025 RepID=A0A931BR91_9HYPH|nr:extracellular solute-binding protein [Microvirga alba]MBF9235436.1 extracellular solute-binding protein [Microvirga alba]
MFRINKGQRLAVLTASVLMTTAATGVAKADPLLFWSTAATPVEETKMMREQVLAGFGKPVQYLAQDPGPFATRIGAEAQAGKGTIGIIGGLHGELASFSSGFVDLSDVVGKSGAKVNGAYAALGKLGTSEQKYVPWMQATYIMAANKKALQYLPKGADLNNLTYAQLIEWGKTMRQATGSPKIGLPAGPKGLIHRFFQGYLYPSYTGSNVVKFRSPEAEKMWGDFKALWAETDPGSNNYGFMQEPLMAGQVWVAWEHTARLKDAFDKMPDDFVAFPVPAGPAGRGFMPVVVGISVPKTSPDAAEAKALAAYMLKPETQITTLRVTGFFPVVDVTLPADMPPSVRLSGAAVAAQSSASNAKPSLLPVGLGDLNGKFNKAFSDTFQRIVLRGEDVKAVLAQQGDVVKSILDEAKAPCWAPDPTTQNVCTVE